MKFYMFYFFIFKIFKMIGFVYKEFLYDIVEGIFLCVCDSEVSIDRSGY